MNKKSFRNAATPLLTVMVQADCPDRIEELMQLSRPEGAEAFGMQFCRMKKEYRNRETYQRLFAKAGPLPVYVTNYRGDQNMNPQKSDEEIAQELVELAECGATLCDVMGDLFDPQPGEVTSNSAAIEKQMALIEQLHEKGAEVVISSHILKFTPAEKVLEIALEYQRRGADICKLVTGAQTRAEELENLRIIELLRTHLDIPFLFLCVGECRLVRRMGGLLGCCMYLCVHEYDSFAAPMQPLLRDMKAIRDLMEEKKP